jgi:hypothetical protein
MTPRQARGAAAGIGYRLDPEQAVRRHRKAVADRCVTLRPAPDTMTYLTALLPAVDGVAAYAALTRHALAVAGQATARGDHALAASIYGTIAENYKAALGADDATTVDMEAKRQAAMERARGEKTQKIAP